MAPNNNNNNKRPFGAMIDKKPAAKKKPDIIDLLASDDDEEDEQLFAPIPSFKPRSSIGSGGEDSKANIKMAPVPAAVVSSSSFVAAPAAVVSSSSVAAASAAAAAANPPPPPPPTMKETKLGSCLFSIVGMAHHGFNPTTAMTGQQVQLEREPKNTHDRNAIRVFTVMISENNKKQMGYLAASDAAMFAPVMDQATNMAGKQLHFTATVIGPGTYSAIAVTIEIFAMANRLLSRFESQPIIKILQTRLGSRFRLVPKPPPPQPKLAPVASSASAVVASSFLSSTALALVENINNANGQAAAVAAEQEQAVRSILSAMTDGKPGAYYRILGLAETCRLADVKAQYRALARMVHPDKCSAAKAKQAFQLVSEAYQTLSDPNLREAYNSKAGGAGDAATMSTTSSEEDLASAFSKAEEIYNMFFSTTTEDETMAANVEMSEMDWGVQSSELENMFDDACQQKFNELPDYPLPPQLQGNVNLMDYQKDGIKWLVHQERQNTPPAWFERRDNSRNTWFCTITGCHLNRKPPPLRGSILADDMGLGKTLQTLALILSNPPQGQTGYPYKRQALGAASLSSRRIPPRATLIICPLSVIANWTMQVKKHINGKSGQSVLSIATYHGSNREAILEQVQSNCHDILLTSYHTLAYDFKKYLLAMDEKAKLKPAPSSSQNPYAKRQKTNNNKPKLFIFDMEFHRVVLDEGHIIRNSKSNFFKSVKNLNSRYKLVVTGTPFVNRPNDIHSLLSFLQAQPLGVKKVFEERVMKKIKERKEIGLTILRTTMAHVALRRTKNLVRDKIKLVKKTVEIRTISWPDGWHKDVHDALYEAARSVFMSFLRAGKTGESLLLNNYMAFIEVVLRVRQSCCNASLVPEERREAATEILKMAKESGGLNPEMAEELLERLRATFQDESLIECPVCMEEIAQDSAVVLRTCKHVFCQPCLDSVTNQLCPLCRKAYDPDDCIQKSAAEQAAKKSKGKCKSGGDRSPKLQALLDGLDEMAPDEKGVIFSQWTSHLNIIQDALIMLGHTFTRIDGTMSPQERIDAMEAFDTERCDTPRTPRFILCSLHACGTGVNLTRGNVVFMMDTWWNEAVEKQAMDRVHRLGQTRPVRCIRLVMGDTLEHRMINLQDAKSTLGRGAMERLNPAEKRLARLTALRDLFQVPEDLEAEWVKW